MAKLMLRPRYILKYSEMAWWFIDTKPESFKFPKRMLGNAIGIQAYRDGYEVLVTSNTLDCEDIIIPSDTIVEGFAPSKNGKRLHELMDVGVVYNCKLHPIT